MIRELGVVLFVILLMGAIYPLFAGPIIEPVGDRFADNSAVEDAGFDGPIETIQTFALRWVPVALMGGMLVWLLAVATREERRGGGGRGI